MRLCPNPPISPSNTGTAALGPLLDTWVIQLCALLGLSTKPWFSHSHAASKANLPSFHVGGRSRSSSGTVYTDADREAADKEEEKEEMDVGALLLRTGRDSEGM